MTDQPAQQATQPDGSVVSYDASGHAISQSWPNGQVTTFQYRGEDYVATTGNDHVLYDANGTELKQWQGPDESSAQTYHSLPNGDYTLTDPKGTVTEYTPDGHLVSETSNGQVTTFQYRGDDYVATTGNDYVLYDANGTELKQWQGPDESSAQTYHSLPNGDYTLTDPKGTVTEYTPDGHLVDQASNGQVTTFQYRGDDYVATTGNDHVLYDPNGTEIKQWQGGDEAAAQLYHPAPGGDYTLTDPQGTVTEYTSDGHLVDQTSNGQVTTFDYRGDDYVATTGDEHVLYDPNGNEIKQWQGGDEAAAQAYHPLGNGDYTLTDPQGTVTEYAPDGHLVDQTSNGQVTTFDYRGDDYVATTGDEHVLYDPNGNEIKQWQGGDEAAAQLYHPLANGNYTLTDGQETVTEYTADGHLVRQTSAGGQVTTFQYRGDDYVATTGDEHVLYDPNGNEIKQWQGSDEAGASTYHPAAGGDYTLTDPQGTVTEYASDGHLVSQTSNGQVTTFAYRGDDYVATTGDEHVLYDPNGNEIKQWQGSDESAALTYGSLPNGDYTLTDPQRTVTEYTPGGKLVKQTSADGQVTTFAYRGDSYVATTGDEHVLYDPNGNEIKQWQGNDESAALTYAALGNGNYTLTAPDGTVTQYNANNQPILVQQPGQAPETIQWLPDGDYIVSQGDQHSKYNSNDVLMETWTGSDESVADHYTYLANGDVVTTGPDGTTEYGPDGMPITSTLPDGTKINWKADLGALNAAVGSVQLDRDAVVGDLKKVQDVFTNIQGVWNSPAGQSFATLSTDFTKATTDLTNALDDALSRMRSSYQNYVDSENQNSANMAQIDQEGHKLAGGVQ